MCLDILNDSARNRVVRDGYVMLTTEWRGEDLCLDVVDNAAMLKACLDDAPGQRWRIERTGVDAYVKLRTQRAGRSRCLDIKNDGSENRWPVMAACDDVAGQNWLVQSRR
jgi:hypothetical protein